LARLEIHTIGDLLLHRPRRHEDRQRFLCIRELTLGHSATTRGKVVACGVKWFRKRTRSIFDLVLDDGTARLHCRWWNLPFMEKYFSKDQEVVVYGKLLSAKPRTIDHPETEVIETGEENLNPPESSCAGVSAYRRTAATLVARARVSHCRAIRGTGY
jgi:ATP-dependent DNA helicase RecG